MLVAKLRQGQYSKPGRSLCYGVSHKLAKGHKESNLYVLPQLVLLKNQVNNHRHSLLHRGKIRYAGFLTFSQPISLYQQAHHALGVVA